MKRTGQTDHLNSSLTDLMTSLMVIFVLLLVTKLNNQASELTSAVNRIRQKIQDHATEIGDKKTKINSEGDVVIIVIPNELMSFQQGSAQQGGAELAAEGRGYLQRHVPGWSKLLCADDVRKDVDTIVVEGHADSRPFGNVDLKRSKEKNLELSQQRSMAVVAEALNILDDSREGKCFLELLAATGRGDAHPRNPIDPDAEENRRVELKIRVRPKVAEAVGKQTAGGTAP